MHKDESPRMNERDSALDLDRRIAYFSMEVGFNSAIPTYSGGLGVLAGDTIRAAADMSVPMVAVTLIHRRGYFQQSIDEAGWQHEQPCNWAIEKFLRPLEPEVRVRLRGRDVRLRAWVYHQSGCDQFTVPILFLDSDLSTNSSIDRELTHYLYGGDRDYRLCQEVILGVGGLRMLRSLGFTRLERFHMNEGHSALLTAELLRENMASHGKTEVDDEAVQAVRRQCVFTTHTPVPEGHDRFTREQVRTILGDHPALDHSGLFEHEGMLNLTYAGLNLSHYVNGVAKKHGEVSQHLFAPHIIHAITNGVHAVTWCGPAMAAVFDAQIPGWRSDHFNLRYALSILPTLIRKAHDSAKEQLIEHIHSTTGQSWDMETLTIGFARRATAYKRPDLLFDDIERLHDIAQTEGPLQLVFAGKAHPKDIAGKQLIQKIFRLQKQLSKPLRLVYLPDYDMIMTRLLVAGVDVWLNTPQPPLEASGTSGMKAALNGVPSLSVLDGWWHEGCIEDVTGWGIGSGPQPVTSVDAIDRADALYGVLRNKVIPKFYGDSAGFLEMMRHSIALNGSFFNTHRMIQQYVLKAYF